MPIYAYRCADCGHSKDVLRKLADPPLTVCPACGAEAFNKQLTAAGFQLKGSGWYVTDFRDGAKGGSKKDGGEPQPAAEKPAADKPATDKPADTPAKSGDGGGTSSSGDGGSSGGSSAASTTPCGGSCACH
jgi:putative FmdB family regulatory protein